MRRAWTTVLGMAALGCAPDAPPIDAPALPQPQPAIDVDPDPAVVEIELVAEPAVVQYVPGIETEVWGYRDANAPEGEATVPGPLIEVALGQRLRVHLRNELPEATTIHWHGLRLPDVMDGNPMISGVVDPGASTWVDIEIRDPGLHWYHPHVRTDVQVQRGLHGTLRVRGPAEVDADAIETERVLVLDDVELDAEGAVVLEATHEDILLGRRGNTLLVNGRIPGHAVARGGTIERWRLVNTSNGRFFVLALADHAFEVIGWDGGPVEPYTVDELVIAPGERFDVLVALRGRAGDALVLETLPYAASPESTDEGPLTLLTLDLEASRGDPPPRPALAAVTIPPLPVDAATPVQRFELRHETGDAPGATFFINDQRWPLNDPLRVLHDEIEVWELVNLGEHPHPFHLHGMYFQVLDRDGVPEPTLGWKDTVRVRPEGTTRLAVRYEALGMWMYHCSIPEHAERGMMGDLVVEPR